MIVFVLILANLHFMLNCNGLHLYLVADLEAENLNYSQN
jgi:hypothetical protein